MNKRSGTRKSRGRNVIGSSKSSKTPKVAEAATAKSLQKILDGISALKLITTPAQAKKAVDEGYPTSPSKFIGWKNLGSSTLYGTHSQYLPSVRTETSRLKQLNKKWDQDQSQKADGQGDPKELEIEELRKRDRYQKNLLALLAGEVILAGKAWELERAQRLHAERLLEQATGRRLSRQVSSDIASAEPQAQLDSRSIEQKVTDIVEHRRMRERTTGEGSKSRVDR